MAGTETTGQLYLEMDDYGWAYRLRLFMAFAARTKLLSLAIHVIISSSSPASLGSGVKEVDTDGRVHGSIWPINNGQAED